MRAILLLLMVTAGCGSKPVNMFELDIEVSAPGAASALVDGKVMIAAVGGVYSRGYAKASDASGVQGSIATLNTDGTVRASAMYQYGTYCAAQMPLLRQIDRFVEGADAAGAPTLTLDAVECEKTDGTGVIITP